MLRKTIVIVALALAAAPVMAGKKVAEAPTVDAIVAKHLEAQGGAAKLRALSSVSFTATDSFDGKTTQIAGTRARPNQFRYEVTEGQKVSVKAFDGTAGWHSTDGKVEMMAADKMAGMKTKAAFDDVLLDAGSRGAKLELEGSDSVNGAPAYVLKITMANGDTQRRFIDAKSFLEVKRVAEWTYNGEKASKTTLFKDFKTVAGIVSPMTSEYERDGKRGTYVTTKVEYDVPVRAAMFAAPAAKAGALPAATAGK
jgi:hypothetical protein